MHVVYFHYVYELLMHRNMFYVFKYLASALYVCMFMFMGARCPDDLMYGSILFAGQRAGDVTMWY